MQTFGKNFWKQAAERAVKTAAQAIAGALIADGANVLNLDWKLVLGAVLTGSVLSLATSVLTAGVGPKDDPSAVSETHV